ncbi:MAG: tetratricopeptide repeat protein [Proteobacteria bacterium]|nr:tetratricopeptide repeat protein [Pseudomonadota bacterium]
MPRLRLALTPLAAVLTLAFALGCQSDSERLQAHLERGDAYLAEERYGEAEIEYKNVVQIDPNQPDAHWGLARVHRAEEEFKEEFWELRETVRTNPENLEARRRLGQLLVMTRQLEEALTQFDAIIEADSDDGGAVVNKAQVLEALDRAEEAGPLYERAVALSPDEGTYRVVLAGYYERRERLGDAQRVLEEFAASEPSFLSLTALGRFAARDRERDAEAEAAFSRALEASADRPERTNASRNLASFLYSRKRYDESLKVLEAALAEQPDDLDMIYLLVRFYRSVGDEDKADAMVRQATTARPDDPRTHLVLSAYRGRLGDREGALAAAEAALEVAPDNLQAKLRQAELLVELGFSQEDPVRTAQGRSIVEAALATQPDSAEALFVRAKIEVAERDPAAAVETLERVLELRPDWPQAHFVLGSTLAAQGERVEARNALARALELDAGLTEARRVLAQIHAGLGEHDYAVEEASLYLRENPNSKATRILAAQSLVRVGRRDEAMLQLKAIPAEDVDAETHYAFGRLLMGQEDWQGARKRLLAAHELRPNHPEILQSLLTVEQRLGDITAAAERINAAVREDPVNGRLVQLQGMVALVRRDADGAERAFKRATELDPDDMQAYEQLATLYRLTGRLQETIETYKKALEVRPNEGRLHHFLAVLYEVDGKPDLARQHYESAIENDSRLAVAKNNLAYLLAEAGDDLDRALGLAQDAKEQLPDSPNAADTLGWVLYKRGVPSAAVGYLQEAEGGMDPSDQTIGLVRHHLALAYEANGEPEQAVSTLERALAELDRQLEEARSSGRQAAEPSWAGELRAMLNRLRESAAG